MIKNILVALDGSGHSNAAIKYGIWLAKNFGAKLSGFHAVDIVLLEGLSSTTFPVRWGSSRF